MKLLILSVLILTILPMTGLFARDIVSENCFELMHSFLRHDQGKVISNKTANIDITKFGLNENVIDREKFERLYTQCLSPEKNEIKALAQKRFTKINVAMTTATTIIGYSEMNWQKPKDMEWFGKLGYNLAFGAAFGAVYSKVIKDNGNRFQYLIKDYVFTRGAVVVFFGGAMILFNPHKAEEKKLEELKKSPTFADDMKKLKAYVKDEAFYKRYEREVMEYLSVHKIINTGLGVHEGIDFDHLTPKDLEDPDIKKVVIAAIVVQEYEQQQGALVVTGSMPGDFMLYDSLYSIVKIPKEIIVGKMINRALCLNSHNPTRGITQAVGITAMNQILFTDYFGITYQVMKKKLIDQ